MSLAKRLLVVCLGNICRSPTAYGFFQNAFKSKKIDCQIDSAGIEAMVDCEADENVQAILQEQYAIDLSNHRAKQITEEMLFENDLILVMDQEQQRYLEKKYPFALGKVHCLGKWRNTSIKDPYHQSKKVFEENIHLIHDCVLDWIGKLWVAA